MQIAFQFATILFSFVLGIVALLGFIGFRSLTDGMLKSLQEQMSEQIKSRVEREAEAHGWRAEVDLSGRTGYLMWRVAEGLKAYDLITTAIKDTEKGLKKVRKIVDHTLMDEARMAKLRNNLAYFSSVRFVRERKQSDKQTALENSSDNVSYFTKYLGREDEFDIPFGAEEFAETRLRVLADCDRSAAGILEIQRILKTVDTSLAGMPDKSSFLTGGLAEFRQIVAPPSANNP